MLNFMYNPDATSAFETPSGNGFTVTIGGGGGSVSSGTGMPPPLYPGSGYNPTTSISTIANGTSMIAILVILLLFWLAVK
jgi:hypothetical protein